MTARRLILGSASPRRRQFMADAGYTFEVASSDADETSDMTNGLAALVESNALLKAKDVAPGFPDALVIGADTLVSIDGDALGKPKDLEQAAAMVQRLSGRTHEVCTGVALCCVQADSNIDETFHVITRVTFKKLDADAIAAYFAKVDPLDKAGAYAAQEHGDDIIERIDGSWSNVVGLPMEELAVQLAAFEKRHPPKG